MITQLFVVLKQKDKQSVQNKARQEVIRILGDDPKDVIPTVEDCESMSYLDMVIIEVMLIIDWHKHIQCTKIIMNCPCRIFVDLV